MAVPKSIEALIGHKLVEVLTKHCISDVLEDDLSRADHVILGKPTDEKRDAIVVSVHVQHPLGPSQDRDRLAMGTPRGPDERPFKIPMETIGGMRSEFKIGTVQLDIRQDVAYEDAIYINGAVSERVKRAINTDLELGQAITDDFGNVMSRIETFESAGYAAGGGDVSIHFRWIDFRMLVHSTNARTKGARL